MTADERREVVLRGAVAEFARGGFDGTSTEDIAARAGISQPYLFRLYSSKKALFIASVEAGFDRIMGAFEAAAKGLDGEEALEAIGLAYTELLRDRELLLVQLQAYAACSDPEIRAATRKSFRRMYATIAGLSGVSGERLSTFVAIGMLLNVSAALQLDELDQDWAQLCSQIPESWLATP
jgi:AcrR family transcriptional regulator